MQTLMLVVNVNISHIACLRTEEGALLLFAVTARSAIDESLLCRHLHVQAVEIVPLAMLDATCTEQNHQRNQKPTDRITSKQHLV